MKNEILINNIVSDLKYLSAKYFGPLTGEYIFKSELGGIINQIDGKQIPDWPNILICVAEYLESILPLFFKNGKIIKPTIPFYFKIGGKTIGLIFRILILVLKKQPTDIPAQK